jgi:hypothetical protein
VKVPSQPEQKALPLQAMSDLLAPAAEADGLDEEELLQHARLVRRRIWRERYERAVQDREGTPLPFGRRDRRIMRDWSAIQERYLRDPLPVRWGGLAANLRRVKSFADHDANEAAVASLVEESKFFVEWTAGEADVNTAAELVEIQVQLAVWQRRWAQIWGNVTQRRQVAELAAQWSDRVLEMSGLLD